VCLIRDDLTTIWCEVTFSVRNKDIEDDADEAGSLSNMKGKPLSSSTSERSASRKRGRSDDGSLNGSDDAALNEVDSIQCKEVLLCLRPIRDGDEKTTEAYRFKPMKMNDPFFVSEDNSRGERDGNFSPEDDADNGDGQRLPKKRLSSSPSKNKRSNTEEIDHAVVESLMSMSSKTSK
jgi:hypothetical protein